MTTKTIMSVFILGIAVVLAAGYTILQNNKGRVPDKTTVSINFVESTPGKTGKLVILNKHGKPVPLPGKISDRKKLPKNAKLKGAVTVRFYQVNPCYTEVCFPNKPCVPVVTEGDCTVVDEPIENPIAEPEPTYVTCRTEAKGLCWESTYQTDSCPPDTESGPCP